MICDVIDWPHAKPDQHAGHLDVVKYHYRNGCSYWNTITRPPRHTPRFIFELRSIFATSRYTIGNCFGIFFQIACQFMDQAFLGERTHINSSLPQGSYQPTQCHEARRSKCRMGGTGFRTGTMTVAYACAAYAYVNVNVLYKFMAALHRRLHEFHKTSIQPSILTIFHIQIQ